MAILCISWTFGFLGIPSHPLRAGTSQEHSITVYKCQICYWWLLWIQTKPSLLLDSIILHHVGVLKYARNTGIHVISTVSEPNWRKTPGEIEHGTSKASIRQNFSPVLAGSWMKILLHQLIGWLFDEMVIVFRCQHVGKLKSVCIEHIVQQKHNIWRYLDRILHQLRKCCFRFYCLWQQ